MNALIKQAIQFFKSKFERPEYWLVVDTRWSIFFKWFLFYGFLSIALIALGLFFLKSIDFLFSKDFFMALFGIASGGVSLFYGISLFHLAFYNILYYMNINFWGEETVGTIRNVRFKRKKVRGNDLSSYSFEVEYNAFAPDNSPILVSIPTWVYKSHRYAKHIQNGKTVAVKFWKKDYKKAKVVWKKMSK